MGKYLPLAAVVFSALSSALGATVLFIQRDTHDRIVRLENIVMIESRRPR